MGIGKVSFFLYWNYPSECVLAYIRVGSEKLAKGMSMAAHEAMSFWFGFIEQVIGRKFPFMIFSYSS